MKEYIIYTSKNNKLSSWCVFGKSVDECIDKLKNVFHIDEEIIAYNEIPFESPEYE